MNFTRPMLAAPLLSPKTEHNDKNILEAMLKLKMPVLATTKRDGIRGLRLNGTDVSRTLKTIPNKSICDRAKRLPAGLDFEHWVEGLEYNEIESIVMSRQHIKSDEIEFHVLDLYHPTATYNDRLALVESSIWSDWKDVKFESPTLCITAQELFDFFIRKEQEESEGICFRTPDSPYKMGRSTLREQYLVKLARYSTSEAMILDFIEQFENGNRTKRNAVGMMDRSSNQENMVGKDTLGALVVSDVKTGVVFNIGTGVGWTDKWRQDVWQHRSEYKSKIIAYKYKGFGEKNLPRSPIGKGMRTTIDL